MIKKPNIIFFFTDQQRWDTCGCYGQKLPVTPNLDRMAAEGVKFEFAFTNQPVCGPARAVLQTGKYCTEARCPTNHCMLPQDHKTVAHWLTEAGYETAYIGKWHLASFGPCGGPDDFRTRPVPLERRGGYKDFWLASDALECTSHSYDGHMFDAAGEKRVFPEGKYRVDAQTDWALEYLEGRSDAKPFFLFLSYLEPHHQNDHHRYEGPLGSKEKWGDYEPPGDLAGEGGDWRENFADYLGCCHALDAALGRIRDALRRKGVERRTLIVYTSDHGSHFRTRNSEYKRSPHDGCIRIPMVIYGPGFLGGRSVKHLVSLIDLPPTLLETAGLSVPAYMRGRPLQKLVASGTDAEQEGEIFIQISEDHIGRALRTAKYTYELAISYREAGEPSQNGQSLLYREACLYDNERDPHQKNNLISEPAYAAAKADLRARLLTRMSEIGEPAPRILSPA